jgi:uncharacterized protein (TIRG00374 family)
MSTLKRSGLKVLVTSGSIALALALLYYSLRGIEWGTVGSLLGRAHLSWVALYCLGSSAALFLRAYRWRILLRAAGEVSVSTAFWATAAGYFGNNFLPARAGEVVRTMMISSRAGLSKTYVLTTALSERMADAIALVIISSLVLLSLPAQAGWLAHAAKPFAAVGMGGVLAIAILPWLEPFIHKLIGPCPIPTGVRERLSHLIAHIVHGIRSFHEPKRIAGFLSLTCAIWCIDAMGAIFIAHALGLSLSIALAFLLITGLGLGSALPSTPGYVGIYQFVAVKILTPAISKTDAIAYILLLQAASYIVVTVWGLIGLWVHRQFKGLVPMSAASRHQVDVRI